jgi:nucleotide-binding universal stress UspA family protein
MPVEFRLGSIFDEACDLLVLPSSAGGTVTPEVQKQVREAGFPFPGAMPWGTITVVESTHPRYAAVAYAAALSGQSSSAEIVEKIGQELGRQAAARQLARISAPVLGSGSGDVPYAAAAAALRRGFLETAPDAAVLVINVRDEDVYKGVVRDLLGLDGGDLVVNAATVKRGLSAIMGAVQRRRERRDARLPAPAGPALAGDPRPRTSPAIAPAQSSTPASPRTRVFVSYSHADDEWLERLQKHLRPLQREGIDVWDDTRLRPGEPWREEIHKALAETKVAILLISADFLASDFIVTDELPPLLKAAEDEGAIILPVILSPCRFARMESLSRFQSVNDPEKPLVQLRLANREKVLDKVARAVEDAFKQ